ncbi:MAG: 4'-phosphopantetheinyl transferase superfamily protein [Candidatus Thiodiazotropha sp.]|jgi:4'-phosphopantetheinyl transferase EntD
MDLATLFPSNVVIVHATEAMWATPVHREEERLIEGSVTKRQRQFRAGRNAAHAALRQLDAPSEPLLRGENRQPIWPQGFFGSISHCDDSCVAACAKDGAIVSLGLDVEPLEPLKPGLARYIETEDEREFMQRHPELPPRLIFSAKESLYKCYYPLVQRFFGFHSVVLDIDISCQRYRFRASAACNIDFPQDLTFHGRYLLTEKHLYTSCFLTQD